MRDELLHRVGMAEIPEVTEDGHEPLRLEWEAVDVKRDAVGRGVDNMFVDDLVSEKGGDDGEETRDEFIVPDNV